MSFDSRNALNQSSNGEMPTVSDLVQEHMRLEAEKSAAPLRTADSLEYLHQLLSEEINAAKRESKLNRILAISALVVGVLTLIATVAGLIATLS